MQKKIRQNKITLSVTEGYEPAQVEETRGPVSGSASSPACRASHSLQHWLPIVYRCTRAHSSFRILPHCERFMVTRGQAARPSPPPLWSFLPTGLPPGTPGHTWTLSLSLSLSLSGSPLPPPPLPPPPSPGLKRWQRADSKARVEHPPPTSRGNSGGGGGGGSGVVVYSEQRVSVEGCAPACHHLPEEEESPSSCAAAAPRSANMATSASRMAREEVEAARMVPEPRRCRAVTLNGGGGGATDGSGSGG